MTETTRKTKQTKIIKGLAIGLSAFMTLFNLGQWFLVSKMNRTEFYAFGEETTQAYFYKSPELFALVHLYWGYLFLGIFGLTGLSLWLNKKFLVIFSLILVILASIAFLYHASIGAH